ncbi:formyltransferase family protein [Clostridium saccharobutylicum]|uniref:Methionyl-tRNA formyltransferase n=1 Tax=Clostridium saccharobutylicum TaxID=169679 RepID=A0A1S8MTH1_CLOSA|nr:formyltransferase family protein [Clostridium saccharobutylicum]OOM07463.1 methionyl-tRNA formyltransferase [Clostridium saccharobutylicum]
MSDYKKKSCMIIGLGSLCISCSEHILNNSDLDIVGIISADESVIKWAKSNNIRCLLVNNKVKYTLSKEEIDKFVKEYEFDYFFSIINAMFLPEWIIKLPKKYAINFHDSALPKYAGIDTTSWVIMNREKEHGVTWHIMSSEIDQGDIIKQNHIQVRKNETAYTLNKRGFAAGFEGFKELLEELLLDKVVLKKQIIEEGSYYSRSKPYLKDMSIWNIGFICWQNCAEDIDALVRALSFGPDRNALGTPKIIIEDCFYIVEQVKIYNSKSNLEQGTVVEINKNSFKVATNTNEIEIKDIFEIDGTKISIEELKKRHNLKVNSKLGKVNENIISKMKDIDSKIIWKENYWVNKLANYELVYLSIENGKLGKAKENKLITKKMILSKELQKALVNTCESNDFDLCKFIFTCFASFLLSKCDKESMYIWYSDSDSIKYLEGVETLYSNYVPCKIENLNTDGFREFYNNVDEEIGEVKKEKYLMWDIFYRYPQLRDSKLTCKDMTQFAYSFNSNENTKLKLVPKFDLSFNVDHINTEILFNFAYSTRYYNDLEEFINNFQSFLTNYILDK